MKFVLIPTKLDPIARETLEAKGIRVVQDADTPLEDLVCKYPDTQALIVRSDKVTAEIIDALPKLRLVVRAGSGYNTIDIKYARKRGVDVMNTPGANANAVAEEVIALALAYYRHVVPADISTREGKWEKKKLTGVEIAGVRLFGLGYGVPVTPFGAWSCDLSEAQAEAMLGACKGADILVTHSPPKGIVDRTSGGMSVGSEAILAAIGRIGPELALCGHIHDSWGQSGRVGRTKVVNLGPFATWFDMGQ